MFIYNIIIILVFYSLNIFKKNWYIATDSTALFHNRVTLA